MITDNNQIYYIGTDGTMKTGFVTINNAMYYFAPSGNMMTGWVLDNGSWYYMSPDATSFGQMVKDSMLTIDRKTYYFGQDGKMAHDTTIDGLTYGSDGFIVSDDIECTDNEQYVDDRYHTGYFSLDTYNPDDPKYNTTATIVHSDGDVEVLDGRRCYDDYKAMFITDPKQLLKLMGYSWGSFLQFDNSHELYNKEWVMFRHNTSMSPDDLRRFLAKLDAYNYNLDPNTYFAEFTQFLL